MILLSTIEQVFERELELFERLVSSTNDSSIVFGGCLKDCFLRLEISIEQVLSNIFLEPISIINCCQVVNIVSTLPNSLHALSRFRFR